MENLPVELSFQIENWGHPDGPVIEILARGPGIEDRVEHARNKQLLRERKITGRDWVILGNVDRHGHYWSEWSFDLDIDDAWVISQIPESVKREAWKMNENPRRPPKKWMRDCVAGASKSARNPGAVCGALWYHKMSPAQRRAALRREGKDSAAALANPSTGATIAWVAGTVAVLGIGYMLLRPKPAAAATATPQPTPSPSPAPSPSPSSSQNPPIPPPSTWPKLPAKTCPVEQFALTTWGKNNGVAAYYLPNLATAPSLSKLPAFITFDLKLPLVVVISDGTFYQYDAAGNAVAAPDLQASYCQSQTFPSYTHGLHPASTFMV